ncbi:MAG: glycosyltransferase family 4 protein [Dehalococcoidia bacterium]
MPPERTLRLLYTLYQGNPYSGGQGVYLYEVTREMAQRGHEVHIIAGSPYPRTAPGVTLHKVESYSFWAHFDDRQAFFGRPPWTFFHPVNFWEFAATKQTLSQLLLMFSLRAYRLMKELGPFDLIHDNQTLAYGHLLMRQHAPLVSTIHHPLSIDRDNTLFQAGNLLERFRRSLWFPWVMQEVVARRSDAVVTVSGTAARAIERAFRVPPEKLHVIYNGVATDVFRPLRGIERDRGHIVYMANTEDANKGVAFLLKACRMLADEGEDFRLTIVDRDEADLNVAPRLVRQLGLHGHVRFTGRLEEDELVALLNRCTFAVCASVYEGFGLPACEAAACGTPLVSTTGGALAEVLEPGVSAHMVPAGDAGALAEGMRRLLHDRALRDQLSATARGSITARFSWAQAGDQLEALYRQVIANRAAGLEGRSRRLRGIVGRLRPRTARQREAAPEPMSTEA